MDIGSVKGFAEIPYWQLSSMDFDLPRPTGVALREYVPGNLIYANGHKFVPRIFHWEPGEDHANMPSFQINMDREAILESNIGQNTNALHTTTLRAMPISDVDLVHQSQISDEEESRFQMGVKILGRELNRHNGGFHYTWGERILTHRRNVHFQMVNGPFGCY